MYRADFLLAPWFDTKFYGTAAVTAFLGKSDKSFMGKRWVDEAARRLFSAILKTTAGLNDIGSRF